jgi:uncharacterized protein involved in exopolysaccharide biosynthesis
VDLIERKVADLKAMSHTKLKGAISAFEKRLEVARHREKVLRAEFDRQEQKVLDLNQKLISLGKLRAEVSRARALYDPMAKRWGELQLSKALKAPPVQVIDPAEEPVRPVKPRKKLVVAAGGFLGLLAGLQLAFILQWARGNSATAVEKPR